MTRRAIVFLALSAVAFVLAASVRADDAPLLSLRRLSVAGQVGVDYQRPTDQFKAINTTPSLKLVPSYSLWGPAPDKATGKAHFGGAVALSFPVKMGVNSTHQLEFGAYLSVILWSGQDQPVTATH